MLDIMVKHRSVVKMMVKHDDNTKHAAKHDVTTQTCFVNMMFPHTNMMAKQKHDVKRDVNTKTG